MPLNDKDPNYWFELARHDIDSVTLLLSEKGYPDIIIYHMHQAAEKLLKGHILKVNAEFPYIHDLERLFKILTDKDARHSSVADAIISLQSYYKDLRYPQSDMLQQSDLKIAKQAYYTITNQLNPH